MRLIDADALKEENKTIIDCEIEHPKYQNTVREIIDSAPTIEIVRCKECKFNYGNEHNCEYNPEDIVCTYWASDGLEVDDFCSYGEREGE